MNSASQDVENLPEKEEVVIWVELTAQQRAYYRALFANQIGTLLTGVSTKNLPGLRNMAMELRKASIHKYLHVHTSKAQGCMPNAMCPMNPPLLLLWIA